MTQHHQAKQKKQFSTDRIILSRTQLGDGRPVITKSVVDGYADGAVRELLNNEHELFDSIHHPNLARVVEYRDSGAQPALILEDPGGLFLEEVLADGALALRHALELGLGLARGLSELHLLGIVHRDMRPENILVSNDHQPRIMSLARATRVTRQQAALRQASGEPSSWKYISPEQTGRISRPVDYRTDLYSLGVILYEMLSGSVPFDSELPLDLLHDHLAVRPGHLAKRQKEVPVVVGDLVARLLEKDPEDRYRSAVGLVSDIERILDRLVRGLALESMKLKGADISSRFQLPERLYGRDEEIEQLNAVFEEAREDGLRLVLVHGFSGIGKSSLINHLRSTVVTADGYMISGKFDQLDRGSALHAVSAAFHDLAQQFLTGDDASIDALRYQLREALGENLGVLVELAPQLELLVGRCELPPRLDATAERQRMRHVLSSFLATLATPQRPVVMVLDDLQWADAATLELIGAMAMSERSGSLMLVGAYRENEVDAAHPLSHLLNRLDADNVSYGDIALQALPDSAVGQMVSDSLGRSPEDSAPLVKLCIKRTDANPFYIRMFMTSLYEDGLLHLDMKTGAWSWDMEQLTDRQLTDNKADLALRRIEGLGTEAIDCLGLMALIGPEGDLAMLTEVRGGRSPMDLLRKLATQELIILTEHAVNVNWKWSHDRIQEAAACFINPDERLQAHQRIGEVLQRRWEQHGNRVSLFSVLRHRNEVVKDRNIVDVALATMNMDGGDAAMRSSGYEAALEYFVTGIRLLGKEQWRTQSDLAFRLHYGAADAARLATRFEDMYRWLRAIDQQRASLMDQVQAQLLEILYLSHAGKNLEAVVIARQALGLLGWNMPKNPSLPRVIAGLAKTRLKLRKLPVAEMAHLPTMMDERAKATVKVLSESLSAAYFADPLLMGLMIQKAMQLTAEHGNCPASAHMYVAYGMLLSAALQKPELGLRYANLGVDLADNYGASAHPARVRFNRDVLVASTTTPLNDIEQSLEIAYAQGMDEGDMGFATGALFFLGLHRQFCGKPLDALEQELDATNAVLRRHAQLRNLNAAIAQRQFIHDVRHGPGKDGAFTGPHINGDEHLVAIDRMASAWTLVFRAMSRFHLGDWTGAYQDHQNCTKYLDSIVGQALIPMHHLYGVLIGCAAHRKGVKSGRKYARKQLKKLNWFAGHNNEELRVHALLGRSALAATEDHHDDALRLSSACIELALERGLPLMRALAASVIAETRHSQGEHDESNSWRQDATEAYALWGADHIAGNSNTRSLPDEARPDTTLDLDSVMSASEAISEQIELDALLTRLMKVTIQNAGAERGILFRVDNNQWIPEAEGRQQKDNSGIEVRLLEPDFEPSAALAAIRLVARTGEPVLSDCAMEDDIFGTDTTVKQNGVRSLLCLPLLNKGRLQGILYLENNQIDGAFTPQRFRMLRILSAQSASALEKARLHDAQRRLIEAQRKFVPDPFITTLGHRDLFEVELGEGTLREMDILFTDIRGFTSIVERMTPGEAMDFINDYLSHMEPAVLEHGGFVDKFIGDAILALFDAGSNDAGVRAGIAMANAEWADNERRATRGLPPIITGTGINTDSVMMGIVGGPTSLRATIIGDAVNLASRLESLTKRYTTRMLISENTAHRLNSATAATLRPLEWLQVVGKTEPTLVFEVIESLPPEVQERRFASLDTFVEAHKYYATASLKEAREGFESVLADDPSDATAQVMLAQVDTLLASGVEFDGPPVTRLEKK